MEASSFIKTARELLPARQGRPRDANLRRAVSTAYYAMFHCLARSCADTLIGKSGPVRKTDAWARTHHGHGGPRYGVAAGAVRTTDAWTRTYRALNHGEANRRCRNAKGIEPFPQSTRLFADTFVRMQKQREHADYAPDAVFIKTDVMQRITEAERAIKAFEKESAADRRAFAAYILFKSRQS